MDNNATPDSAEILVKSPRNNPNPIKIRPQIFKRLITDRASGFSARDLKKSENNQVDSNK